MDRLFPALSDVVAAALQVADIIVSVGQLALREQEEAIGTPEELAALISNFKRWRACSELGGSSPFSILVVVDLVVVVVMPPLETSLLDNRSCPLPLILTIKTLVMSRKLLHLSLLFSTGVAFQRPIASRSLQSATQLLARPKKDVDSYQTVSVSCAKCGERIFRYKKKNGTKSNLVKCFVERIVEDSAGVLSEQGSTATEYSCPSCDTAFARSTMIRGLPALKMVGGKTRMTKK